MQTGYRKEEDLRDIVNPSIIGSILETISNESDGQQWSTINTAWGNVYRLGEKGTIASLIDPNHIPFNLTIRSAIPDTCAAYATVQYEAAVSGELSLVNKVLSQLIPTTIHNVIPSTQQVFVSDERDTLDDSSFVSMRQAQ